MKELQGDIWDFHDKGEWIIITTNGTIRKDGACVMGRGVAKEASIRFPQLPYKLGETIKNKGNHVHARWGLGLIVFPVKHNWHEKADIELIKRSCNELNETLKKIDEYPERPEEGWNTFYMVRPGCGNGGLDWKDVKGVIEPLLDSRVVIVEREKHGN